MAMTPEMLADYRAGMPLKVMARKYGTSENRIKNLRRASGEPARRDAIAESRSAKMRELWHAGVTHPKMAEALGMSIGGAKALRHRLGLPKRPHGRPVRRAA